MDNDDDDETTTDEQASGSQAGAQVARIHCGVNLTRLAAECSTVAGQWPAPVWAAAVDLILSRAKSRVARPQPYVTGSITNEPGVMLDAAEAVAGSDDAMAVALMAENELSQGEQRAAARRITCPTHLTEHREDRECGGCRADRLAQRPQEG